MCRQTQLNFFQEIKKNFIDIPRLSLSKFKCISIEIQLSSCCPRAARDQRMTKLKMTWSSARAHVRLTLTAKRPAARFSKVPKTFRARKAISKPAYSVRLIFWYVVKGIQLKNNCKFLCLETPPFWRYKEKYVTRNSPEKFRDFRQTGPRKL